MSSAVKNMNGDEAPSPKSFILAFFQKYRGVVKEGVMKFFQEIHLKDTFKSPNTSFM